MFDWSVNLGHLLTIGTFIITIAGFIMVMRDRVDAMSRRMVNMEIEMKKIVEVLVQQGRLDERMTAIDGRMLAQGQRIDDLTRKLDRFFDVKDPLQR